MKKVLGLFAVAVLFAACSNGGASIVTPTQEASEEPTSAPTQSAATVGDQLVWDDMKMTFEDAEGWPGLSDYFAPDPGNKYVTVLIVVEALVDGISYNTLYFTLTTDEGYSYTPSIWSRDPDLGSSNELRAGRKAKGWVTFEVPKGESTFFLQLDDYSHIAEWKFTVAK